MADSNRNKRRSEEIRRRRTGSGHTAQTSASVHRSSSRSTPPAVRTPIHAKRTTASSRRPAGTVNRQEPPVLVRGVVPGFSTRTGRHTQEARRRYDVALRSSPGAEIRLPSLPSIALGWRLVSFFLVVALGGLLYLLWTSPMYQVKVADVKGLERLTTADVNAVLAVTGHPVFTLNPNRLSDDLRLAFPEFSRVEVEVGLPNKVQVTVVERRPIILWKQGGRTDLVDAEGMAFPLRSGAAGESLVVVEALDPPPAVIGLDVTNVMTGTVVGPEIDLSAVLPGAKQPAPDAARPLMTEEMVAAILTMSTQVPQGYPVVYSERHGLGWRDEQGWEAYFGDTKDIEAKLRVYQALIKDLAAEEIQPELVSVEYVHAPYYRVER